MPTLSRRVPAIVSSILLTLGVGLMVLGVVLMDARETLLTPEGLASRAGGSGRSTRPDPAPGCTGR